MSTATRCRRRDVGRHGACVVHKVGETGESLDFRAPPRLSECLKSDDCVYRYVDANTETLVRQFRVPDKLRALLPRGHDELRALVLHGNVEYETPGGATVVVKPVLYEYVEDVSGDGEVKETYLATTEDGDVVGAYVHIDAKTGRVYDAFFSPKCDAKCVEKVRRFAAGRPLGKRRVWRGVHTHSLKVYDFGAVKVWLVKPGPYAYIYVERGGKGLGGTLAYALRMERDKAHNVAKYFAPYAKKLASELGHERARRMLAEVLKDAYPLASNFGKIETYLDKVFELAK